METVEPRERKTKPVYALWIKMVIFFPTSFSNFSQLKNPTNFSFFSACKSVAVEKAQEMQKAGR